MQKLSRDDLFTLEKYAEVRPEFRARVMAHKKNRQLPIGPNATLYFEDALTMQYQIQEMLFAYEGNPLLDKIDRLSSHFIKRSYWIFVGDGSAYDISFGGIDHVLAARVGDLAINDRDFAMVANVYAGKYRLDNSGRQGLLDFDSAIPEFFYPFTF